MAVGCSHGLLIDPRKSRAVLDFKEKFKPDTLLHLGDGFDFAALRRKATPEERSLSIKDDVDKAYEFLEEYFDGVEQKYYFYGNHDMRPWDYAQSPIAVIRDHSRCLISEMTSFFEDHDIKTVDYHIRRGWKKFGDTAFGHGYMGGANGLIANYNLVRSAKSVAMAHFHYTASLPVESIDPHARVYCCGTLGDLEKFTYAHRTKAFLKWGGGALFGEYNSRATNLILSEETSKDWRIAI